MPSTFDPLLRLELQAVGENPLTWGIKTNTNLQLLAQAVSGHLSIDVGGSGTYTLSTSNAGTDEARYAFITLTGTLTGNRIIQIPSNGKTYYFRNATTGAFTLSIKTAAGSPLVLPSGVSNIVCDGVNVFVEGASTDFVNAQVSALAVTTNAAISVLATSVSVNTIQIAAVSSQVSASTVQINAVSVLAQQALVSAGQKVDKGGDIMAGQLTLPTNALPADAHAARVDYVNTQRDTRVAKAGDIMTGFLTLHADPTSALHAATKQYVDAGDNELRGGVSSVIATTSGTAHDVTGLPSWVNEIEVMFRGVSLDAGGLLLLQLGTSGGILTSGYLSGAATRFGSSAQTTGFIFGDGLIAGTAAHGIIRLVKDSGNVWTSMHSHVANTGDGFSGYGGGSVNLGGTLTQVRFTRTGTANFDAGNFVVRWRR